MQRISIALVMALLACGCSHEAAPAPSATAVSEASKAAWAVTLDNIEACSCPTFCQCYFSGQPALHEAATSTAGHAMRFCRFNNAFRVSEGHYGATNLAGMKFWMAGDLGGDFSKGQMDWVVVRFEPSATPQQREAAIAIVNQIFPVKWNSFTSGQDAKIDWSVNDDSAVARLNEGKSAEVVLKQTRDSTGKPVVIQNVQFWAAPSNSGFRIMKNDVEAYRDGDKPFEFKQTNGFFTTIRMSASDMKGAQATVASRIQLLNAGSIPCDQCCRN
jgi:hypothetical protein